MLAYILALAVAAGSIAIYMVAFLFPKIHRKNDFIWSGVGLFYALVLWIFARKITGGLLLGHVASVALIAWFVWQTMTLRQQVPIPVTTQSDTATESSSSLPQPLAKISAGLNGVLAGVTSRFQKDKPQPQDTKRAETTSADTAVERLRNVQDESATFTPTETPTVVETQSNAEAEMATSTDASVAPFPEETAVSTTADNLDTATQETGITANTSDTSETASQEAATPSDSGNPATEENPPTPPAS